MKLTAKQFERWENKCVTLLGMAGVGKTRFATLLRRHDWFHYSADYRVGTRYLDEAILDNVKVQAMQVPFLRDLLRSDSIYFCNNITVDNLQPVTSFLGQVGNPELGGLPLKEFKKRQDCYRSAATRAMLDVPEFIRKARRIYGYKHFVNDAAGSLCELDGTAPSRGVDPAVVTTLAEHTLILYIRATPEREQRLLERAADTPRPLLYREEFLDEQLKIFMAANNLSYVALIDPAEFARWVYPRLLAARLPRYESISERYGYTVSSDQLTAVRDDQDFAALIAETLAAAE